MTRRGRSGEGMGWVPWRGWLALALLLTGWLAGGKGTDVAAAAQLVEGPTVEAGARRATVRWTTDVATGARVRFGTRQDRLDRQAEGPVEVEHSVELVGLQPGTTHYFTVGTARVVLATRSFATVLEGATNATNATSPTHPTNLVGAVGVVGSTNSGVSAIPAVGPGTGTGGGAGGTVASPAAGPQAPPARESWGSLRTLADHFERHGRDFAAKDAEDYARQAWEFRRRAAREGLPAKRDTDGVLRIYDPRTRAFGAYNRDGTTRTYFKPGRKSYFDDQPGRPVDLKREER